MKTFLCEEIHKTFPAEDFLPTRSAEEACWYKSTSVTGRKKIPPAEAFRDWLTVHDDQGF